MKFSGKMWSDHGTTWFNFGSIRLNGSASKNLFVITGHRTGVNKSVSFARWQQGAGFVVPRTTACFFAIHTLRYCQSYSALDAGATIIAPGKKFRERTCPQPISRSRKRRCDIWSCHLQAAWENSVLQALVSLRFHVVLYEAKDVLAYPLKLLFDASLRLKKLPEDWRTANIVPVFKRGDKKQALNYRPISLTSVVCKLIESIVREHSTNA